jgi:hypothetical protein
VIKSHAISVWSAEGVSLNHRWIISLPVAGNFQNVRTRREYMVIGAKDLWYTINVGLG